MEPEVFIAADGDRLAAEAATRIVRSAEAVIKR